DERTCWILHNLSSGRDFGGCLCGACISLELHVPWWICMGWLIQTLQLAPGPHGYRHGAAIVYRIPQTWGHNKLPWKLVHAGLLLLSLILSVVGLCAVFSNHNANRIPNLYSLHSWMGIFTVTLFAAQWVVGFAAFLLPCTPMVLRAFVKPTHIWMGGMILVLSIVSCISGINEKLFFALKGNTNGTQPYSVLPPEAIAANSLGVILVAFGLVVLKILSNQSWQRPELGYSEGVYRPLAYDGS
ncbi:hypothetical protein DNTS_023697, partial [Danionella cerebrum]